ncbi:bifunctional adenosylcobinamide kinase/adenosylcobinamide-phosphate guanylyltransferase [Clostridium oceanicum]|uniref:Adenosylcobinamide kinase n=1 Tax=Clostridium oceanicum TaxID=1543 RepID=A0ABP3UN60_9CLOT
MSDNNFGKVVLITGGVRSGKSEFAEELLNDKEDVLYIATAKTLDKEMEDRVYIHKKRRKNSWKTYEGYKDLNYKLKEYDEKYILLDCVTNMITNLMFDEKIDYDKAKFEELEDILKNIKNEFYNLIKKVRDSGKTIVFVTNEVGYGVVPEYKLGRIFRDFSGNINKYIASLSDEVFLVSCGIPLKLK